MHRITNSVPSFSLSAQAAIQQFKEYESQPNTDVVYKPQKSIGACFTSVQDGAVDYSLVPFENSSNGQVVLTYDLFRDWFTSSASESAKKVVSTDTPRFTVISEQFVPIHHNLITFADDVTKITKIYSHPQVWTQCRRFLAEYELDNNIKVEKLDTSSTSKAVENLLHVSDPEERQKTAAIASSTASEIHNVPIKIPSVEDFSGNTTRFLCLGPDSAYLDQSGHQAALNFTPDTNSGTSNQKMHLLTFLIKRNDDFGSLCDILEKFKKYNLNLQTITTRPSIDKPWQYVFFVEVWDGNEPDALKACLAELEPLVFELSVVGSFYRSRRFFEMLT